jgi:hypothetical protein
VNLDEKYLEKDGGRGGDKQVKKQEGIQERERGSGGD